MREAVREAVRSGEECGAVREAVRGAALPAALRSAARCAVPALNPAPPQAELFSSDTARPPLPSSSLPSPPLGSPQPPFPSRPLSSHPRPSHLLVSAFPFPFPSLLFFPLQLQKVVSRETEAGLPVPHHNLEPVDQAAVVTLARGWEHGGGAALPKLVHVV